MCLVYVLVRSQCACRVETHGGRVLLQTRAVMHRQEWWERLVPRGGEEQEQLPVVDSKFLRRMLTGKTTPTPTSRSGCPSRSAAAKLRQRGWCRFRRSFPRTRRFGRDAAGDGRRLCARPFRIGLKGTSVRTLRSQKGVADFVLVVGTMVCSGTARSASRFPITMTIAITITITITMRIPRPGRRMKPINELALGGGTV